MNHRTGSPRFIQPCLAACLAILLLSSAPPAFAQSQSELRKENQRLQAELNDLAREHAEAKKEIEGLMEEIRRLRELLAQLGQTAASSAAVTPPAPEPEVSIDETIPNASPRALFGALRESYFAQVQEYEIGTSAGDPARDIYLRNLQQWRARTNREFRSTIEWHVKMVGAAVPAGRGLSVRLQAVDPETLVELGDPFDAAVSRSLASRLQQREERSGLDDVLVLRGVLVPRTHINEERASEGAFNNPRLIGPFAEFLFTVDAHSLVPAADDPETPRDAAEAE